MSSASFVLRLMLASVMTVAACGCGKKPDDSASQSNPQPPRIVDPYTGKSLGGIVRHAELMSFKRLLFEIRGGEGHDWNGNLAYPNTRIFVGDSIFTQDVHVLVDAAVGDKTYVNFGYNSCGYDGTSDGNPPERLSYSRPEFLEIVIGNTEQQKQWEAYIANIAEDVSVGIVTSFAVSANYCLAELREDFSDAHYVATVRKKNVRVIVDPNATPTPAYRWDYYENTLDITMQTPEDAERWQERLEK